MGLLNKHLAAKNNAAPAPTQPQQAAAPENLKTVEATVQASAPKTLFGGNKPVAQAPAPTPVVAVSEQKPVESRAVSTFDPFALITGSKVEDANAVLAFVLEEADKAPNFDGPFPAIVLGKGNSTAGGKWQLAKNVPPELRAVLPVGDDTFTAVFLGFRIYGVAWNESKAGNDDRQALAGLAPRGQQGQNSEHEKPIWKVQIGFADAANVQAAMKAGEAYQFTKGAEKGEKFDGLGHFRPGVEMVFYTFNPVDGSPVVFAIKLPDHYTSTQRALENLGRTMAGLGGLQAAPLEIAPYSTTEKGKTPWQCHSVRVSPAVTKKGQDVWASFQAIKVDLMADTDFSRDFGDWNKTDATPEALEALHAIAAMAK